MRRSNLEGRGDTLKQRPRFAPEDVVDDEFPSSAKLGSDGIGYIVIVHSSAKQAAEVTAEMEPVTANDWSEFMESLHA